MRTLTIGKIQPMLNINEDQVSKFYQQREASKRKTLHQININKENIDNDSQPEYKNLFRRKSLANRAKEDSSLFTSFNNSIEFQRPLANSIVKRQPLARFGGRICSVNDQKEQICKTLFQQQESLDLQQSTLISYADSVHNSQVNYSRTRSNSLQLGKSSSFIRNQTNNSFNQTKPLRQTVPLSSILKKYQEEVDKLQGEGLKLSDEKPVHKSRKMFYKQDDEANKQNYSFQQPDRIKEKQKEKEKNFHVDYQKQRKLPDAENHNVKLPDVVEQCIDKWKNLQIQHLKAERFYSKVKQEDNNYCKTIRQEDNISNKIKQEQKIHSKVVKQKDSPFIKVKQEEKLYNQEKQEGRPYSKLIQEEKPNSNIKQDGRLWSIVRQLQMPQETKSIAKFQPAMTQSKIQSEALQQKFTQQKHKYENKIKEQQEYIKSLQKQNTQFKKFTASIHKMKLTLENTQAKEEDSLLKDFKKQTRSSVKRQDNLVEDSRKEKDCQNEIEFNLKQLWRWIKSLPAKKPSDNKRPCQQSIR